MGTLLAQDIPGSSLTIAFQNSQQDSATRKFLVASTGRADAITTVTNSLATANHPDESALKANQVTAQAAGPGRWLVTVQYIRGKIGGFPSVNLCNMRVSYEAVEVYCTTSSTSEGLPFGGNGKEFVNPGRNNNADPSSPPRPWVFNSPVLNIQIPFSSTTNPAIAQAGSVGTINSSSFELGGISSGTMPTGTVRFDGAEIKSVGPSGGSAAVRYFGTESYTFKAGGWHKQVIEFDNDEEQWIASNQPYA